MFLIRLSICIDFIIAPVTPGLGYSNLHKKSITTGGLSGQYYFGQKGQSYCSQRGQSCLAKRVKVAWLFQGHDAQLCGKYGWWSLNKMPSFLGVLSRLGEGELEVSPMGAEGMSVGPSSVCWRLHWQFHRSPGL